MAEKDLIPLKKGDPRAKELGRKGGLAKTKAKSMAQKIRWLKVKSPFTAALIKAFKSDNPEEVMTIWNSIISRMGEITDDNRGARNEIYQLGLLSDHMEKMFKARYGDKNTNLNINIDLNEAIKNWRKEIKDYVDES